MFIADDKRHKRTVRLKEIELTLPRQKIATLKRNALNLGNDIYERADQLKSRNMLETYLKTFEKSRLLIAEYESQERDILNEVNILADL